jgi:hypothetical protein
MFELNPPSPPLRTNDVGEEGGNQMGKYIGDSVVTLRSPAGPVTSLPDGAALVLCGMYREVRALETCPVQYFDYFQIVLKTLKKMVLKIRLSIRIINFELQKKPLNIFFLTFIF